MKLPSLIETFVQAQNDQNTKQYADCFSETATVRDEGQTYIGKNEIKLWNEKTNYEYKTILHPLAYESTVKGGILIANVNGNFRGSPFPIGFHFEIEDGLIQSLSLEG